MSAIRLASTITAVTVFSQGALVSRSADLATLADRPRQVRLAGLPLCLDDGSVQVRCAGAVASDLAVVLEVPSVDATLPPADDQALRAAVLAHEQALARLEQVQARSAELEALAISERPQPARGGLPLPSPTAARLALVAFRQERARALAAEEERLQEELRLAGERRAAAQVAADAATSARQVRPDELRKTVLVTLDWPADASGAAGGGALVLDYLVPGARWTPSYVVRFAPDLANVRLQVRAAVCQQSGEDWTAARLTLSTADVLGWHDLPELPSLRIGRRQAPPDSRGWRAPPTGAEELYADYDLAQERAPRAEPSPPRDDDDDGQLGRGGNGAASASMPPPAPKSAPAKPMADRNKDMRSAQRMAAGAAKKRSEAKVHEAEESYADEVAAPAPVMRSRSMAPAMSMSVSAPAPGGGAFGGLAEGGGSAKELDAEPPSNEPGAELLDFRNLLLPAPSDDDRGRLRAGRAAECYRLEWTGAAAALGVIANAQQAAGRASHLELPARCQAPVSGQFAYSYPAELPVTVASDGAWHVVPLAERTATASVAHVVVPREAREVFRVAEFANPLELPLLPGPADVYLGERFFLAVDLRLTVASGTVRLGLGVEQGITVARNAAFREDATGLLRGSLALEHKVTIDIANKLPREVAIEVRERIPVAAEGEKDCAVKLGAVVPPWEDWRPDDRPPLPGGHRWRVRVAPGATQQLAFTYTVTIPAKQELAGGNRREA